MSNAHHFSSGDVRAVRARVFCASSLYPLGCLTFHLVQRAGSVRNLEGTLVDELAHRDLQPISQIFQRLFYFSFFEWWKNPPPPTKNRHFIAVIMCRRGSLDENHVLGRKVLTSHDLRQENDMDLNQSPNFYTMATSKERRNRLISEDRKTIDSFSFRRLESSLYARALRPYGRKCFVIGIEKQSEWG